MPESIKATELPLNDVFADAFRFEIPPYQRPYTWTIEQTSELIDDVLYAMRQADDVRESSPYFLGSIVIIKDDSSPLSLIVDGQQRITTLTILFSALRELADPAVQQNLHGYVQEDSNPLAGVEGNFRLSVRQRDRGFFRDSIQSSGAWGGLLDRSTSGLPDSHLRMVENAKYLWRELSKLDEAERFKLGSYLVQRCYLVVVSTSDQSSAYRIFSVLNDRGLDLSPTDILKADIIGSMADRDRSGYTEKWEDIEDSLGRDEFRDLFTYIRMIYMKDKARGALNDEFRRGVLNQLNGMNFIDDVLEPYADVYGAISGANSEIESNSDRINQYLTYLGGLDNSDWIPPAMAFFNHNQGDGSLILRFIRDLERLAYGMFIRRANINERISRYAQVIRAIESGDDLFGDAGPLQLTTQETTDILNALEGPVYQQTRVRMPLLLRVDDMLSEPGVEHKRSIVTVEHVLPQNPSDDSEWTRCFSHEEREHWTHRLANLVLLSRRKNSQSQNYEFGLKKTGYFQKNTVSTFALTSQVLSESEWTPEVLERRQRDLINRLKRQWRLG